jgi:DNA-binding CsgD family transcriptional regulator
MTLYMDRHELGSVTPQELAQAHICDLEVQDKYGVKFVTYWYHYGAATGFCLLEAPNRTAVESAHREAHGNLACEIIEVDWDVVEGFMGRIREPGPGEAWEEPPLRAIVCTNLGDANLSSRATERVVRQGLRARGGRDIDRDEGVVGCFPSVVAALEYGLAMQQSFVPLASLYSRAPVRARVGIEVGEPVTEGFGLFGSAIETAASLCAVAQPGETLVTAQVGKLTRESGFLFEERGTVALTGTQDSATCFSLLGKEPIVRDTSPRAVHALESDGVLSPREKEVLILIAKGHTNQEIADRLFISFSTVATHVRRIFEKTEVANRAEAASYAYRSHLLS